MSDAEVYKSLLDDIVDASSLKAEYIERFSEQTEAFLNNGITDREMQGSVASEFEEFDAGGWVDSDLIYKPEFYGAPSPRMMAVSGQAHWRETPDSWSDAVIFNAKTSGSGFIGIPGACTTIKLRHAATVNIMASFYCFELGGVAYNTRSANWFSLNYPAGIEGNLAGTIAVSINGSTLGDTERKVYTSLTCPRDSSFAASGGVVGVEGEYDTGGSAGPVANNGFLFFHMASRHQHSIHCQANLPPGVHNIGLAFSAFHNFLENPYEMLLHYSTNRKSRYGLESHEVPTFDDKKNIIFKSRNFVVDAYYSQQNYY